MDVISLCPLRATSIAWQPYPGAWRLTVVCKATFRLVPVTSVLADVQEDINGEDNHWNDDRARSVYSPSDLAPFKPSPEVMLVGHAFAPRGDPVASLLSRIVVGEVDKSIEIFMDEVLTLDGGRREGPRFAKMPLRYERAAGGPETSNPVGVRLDAADGRGAVKVPNLRRPGVTIGARSDFVEPVGFGPIAADWPTRRQKTAALARPWSGAVSNEPLPEGLDAAYFMSGPPDQTLAAIRPDERIILENLHAEHPRLVTNLPGVVPRVFVDRPRRAPSELKLNCDTLWIDTDRSICTLTWRGQVHLESPSQPGHVVVSVEKAGVPLSWANVEPQLRSRAATSAAAPPVNGAGKGASAVQPAPLAEVPADVPAASGGDITLTGAMSRSLGPAWLEERAPPPPARAQTQPPSAGPAPLLVLQAAPPAPAVPSPAPPLPPRAAPSPWAARGPRPPAAPSFGPPPPAPPSTPGASTPPAAPPAAPVEAPRETVRPVTMGGDPAYPPARPVPAAPSFRLPPPPMPSAPALPAPPPAAAPAPPPAELMRDAAKLGAAAASDAAALVAPPAAPKRDAAPAAPSKAAAPPSQAAGEHVDLVWFDPDAAPRIRTLLVEAAPAAASVSWLKADPGAKSEARDVKDRREVLRALARGNALEDAGLADAVAAAFHDDGTFDPPVVLVGGEVCVTFDEGEALRATIAVATPFVGTDKKLREAIANGEEALKAELPGDIAEGLTARIEAAFAQGSRAVAPGYLQGCVERVLLEGRRYQKKTIAGQRRIRLLLTPAGAQAPIPTYLPENAGAALPVFRRFRARAAVEVRPQEDQYESHRDALLVLALGRSLRDRRTA